MTAPKGYANPKCKLHKDRTGKIEHWGSGAPPPAQLPFCDVTLVLLAPPLTARPRPDARLDQGCRVPALQVVSLSDDQASAGGDDNCACGPVYGFGQYRSRSIETQGSL